MSKMSDVQNALAQAAGTRRKADPPPVPDPAPLPAKVKVQAGREGKRHIGAYLDPAFTTNLLMAKAKTGKNMEVLIADALNDLFRGLNLPVIGQDD